EVEIQVLIDGTTTVVAETDINTSENESYTFTGLPKYDKDGNEINYKINEVYVPGYVAQIDGYNITNTRTAETDISVTKNWLDEDETDRPDEITVQLFQNGEEHGHPVIIKEEDNWKYTFEK